MIWHAINIHCRKALLRTQWVPGDDGWPRHKGDWGLEAAKLAIEVEIIKSRIAADTFNRGWL